MIYHMYRKIIVPSPPEEANVLPHMSQVKHLINKCMYHFMHKECTGMCKRFSTSITSVRFNIGVISFMHLHHKLNVSHSHVWIILCSLYPPG